MKSNRNTTCKFIVCNQALVGVQANTNLQDVVCLRGSLVVRYFFLYLFIAMVWIEIKFNSSVFGFFHLPWNEICTHFCNYIKKLPSCSLNNSRCLQKSCSWSLTYEYFPGATSGTDPLSHIKAALPPLSRSRKALLLKTCQDTKSLLYSTSKFCNKAKFKAYLGQLKAFHWLSKFWDRPLKYRSYG